MKIKKYLPFIILFAGIAVLVAGFFLLRNKGSEVAQEETAPEVPFEQRPFVTLTPNDDGHWLKMNISNLTFSAQTLEYELLYSLPDGRNQGVPGTVKLMGNESIERDLLLGSESSGKFRYDEGVEEGTLTLKYRDEKGKLTGKLTSQFHLQANTDKLGSVDGVFSYLLDEKEADGYYITMNTLGLPKAFNQQVNKGPYGVFSNIANKQPGKVSLEGSKIYVFDNDAWLEISDGASNIGVFLSSN